MAEFPNLDNFAPSHAISKACFLMNKLPIILYIAGQLVR